MLQSVAEKTQNHGNSMKTGIKRQSSSGPKRLGNVVEIIGQKLAFFIPSSPDPILRPALNTVNNAPSGSKSSESESESSEDESEDYDIVSQDLSQPLLQISAVIQNSFSPERVAPLPLGSQSANVLSEDEIVSQNLSQPLLQISAVIQNSFSPERAVPMPLGSQSANFLLTAAKTAKEVAKRKLEEKVRTEESQPVVVIDNNLRRISNHLYVYFFNW
jgi:hypothetical protein